MSKKVLNESKEVTGLAVQDVKPGTLMAAIAQAVSDPRMDPVKMAQLYDLHERMLADQRKVAFNAALARLAPKMPEIDRNGMSHHGKYSRLIDIHRAITPIISEEGFAIIWDQPADAPGGKIRVSGRLLHCEGHSESRQIDLPIDNSGSKNGAQAVISTVSYGKRAITKMFFNLVEATEDTDGNDPGTISEEQARDINALIDEVKADRARFLSYMGVASTGEILAKDFTKAITALESKRRGTK